MFLRLCCFVFVCSGVVFSWDDEEPKPSFLTANVGDHVVFNCELDFPQDIPISYILKWNKDGRSIFSWYEGIIAADVPYVGRISVLDTDGYGKGSINLTSIRESDNGWYQCQVQFPNRHPSTRNNGTWFYLTVTGGNLLEIPPINQTALEGEEVIFVCRAKSKETLITWYKDGIPIKDLSDLRSRSFQSEDGTLTIRMTTMSDLGEYECEAGDYGEKQSARAYLDVQFKAKVIYAPKEVYFPYGRPAILDCHFRSNPPLNNLRWEKDGFLFDPYNVQGVFYKRNGSLFFSKVDEAHGGQYSCTPYNELGTDGPSPPTRVIVQRPPVFIVTPNNLYLRKTGDNIEMPCDARDGDGGHQPTIVWYKKDGTPLPEGRYNIHSGNLTIVNIQEEDRGLYQCSASNQAATITTETELMVENLGTRSMFNITANSSQNAVTLKWNAGYVRPQLDYSVWYRPVDQAEWRMMKIQSRANTEATVLDLSPGREYEFMVLSQDRNGDGMFSKSIKIKTKGSGYPGHPEEINGPAETFAPIGSPKNVSVHPTVEGYLVTWEVPEFGKESIKMYKVKWFKGSMEELEGSAITTELFHNVQYLEEDNTYFFQVFAVSDDYTSSSEKVILMVPAYKKIRAISITIMTCISILGAAFGAFYYLRKRCCKSYDEKKGPHNSS